MQSHISPSKCHVMEEKIRRKFNKACVDYHLLEDGDRILLALSGGKDSLELCRLMAQRARIFKPSIWVEAAHVVMAGIPYETSLPYLERFCQDLGVRLHVLHGHLDGHTDARKTRCFLCSWHRRKLLFSFAAEKGFNKVAFGHHQDDILTTWLMNLTFEGSASSMRPIMQMEHYPLQLIRPLCLVEEAWIAEVACELGFERQKAPCPYEEATRRSDINGIFHQLEALNPEARYSLWRAMEKCISADKQPICIHK